eukprot:11124105-Alexandrium_andersonii.AAC.1
MAKRPGVSATPPRAIASGRSGIGWSRAGTRSLPPHGLGVAQEAKLGEGDEWARSDPDGAPDTRYRAPRLLHLLLAERAAMGAGGGVE